MEDFKRFLFALEGTLSAIRRDRMGLYRTAALQPLHRKIKERYALGLRRAAEKLTEVDVDVMEDLMKLVKKLGRQAVSLDNGLESKLKLTLELMQYAIGKARETHPDHLIWLFNKIFHGLSDTIPDSPSQNSKRT